MKKSNDHGERLRFHYGNSHPSHFHQMIDLHPLHETITFIKWRPSGNKVQNWEVWVFHVCHVYYQAERGLCIIVSSTDRFMLVFGLPESLLAPFLDRNSFRWIMQQRQQEVEIMKQTDERGIRAWHQCSVPWVTESSFYLQKKQFMPTACP